MPAAGGSLAPLPPIPLLGPASASVIDDVATTSSPSTLLAEISSVPCRGSLDRRSDTGCCPERSSRWQRPRRVSLLPPDDLGLSPPPPPTADEESPFSLPEPPAAAASTTATATATAAARSGPAGVDIEMEPVVGHRRRKSSLINPVNSHPPPSHAHRSRLSVTIPHEANEEDADEATVTTSVAATATASASTKDKDKDDPSRASFSSDDHLCDDEEMGLSAKDRDRRRKRRKRIRQLDNRIAPEKDPSADEVRAADEDVVRRLLVNALFILLWYMFSLSISLYNKWMFDKNRLNLAFPLFTTSTHMLVQFFLAGLVLYLVPSLRPQQAHNSDGGRSRHETEPNSSAMSKMFYLTRIGPCGAATGLDIGLGNASLKFISLTFYTMCKSSSLAFVLLFAFLFRLETPTWRLVAIIGTMTMGVILMVFGEVEFKLGGFVLVISAAFFSGFRWGLTQILLLRNPATSNPFSSIFYLSPVMFITLLSLAVPVEGFGPLWEGLVTLSHEWGVVTTPLFLLFPGCIAFLMTACEFALLQRTSVVTLSIAGIFKEVVTISAASVVFEDRLTVVNAFGLLTTMLAIVAYNYIKISKMRHDAQVDAQGRSSSADAVPLSPCSSTGSDSASDADADAHNHHNNIDDDDDDDDDDAENAALLYTKRDLGQQPLVTSDGDIQPNLLPAKTASPSASKEHDQVRSGR